MKSTPIPNKVALLSYRPHETSVPVLVAKGQGELANRILDVASQHNIPLVTQPDLLEHLYKLQINHPIPPNLYSSVATLLAFVLLADQIQPKP